jgi:hypothetical protein
MCARGLHILYYLPEWSLSSDYCQQRRLWDVKDSPCFVLGRLLSLMLNDGVREPSRDQIVSQPGAGLQRNWGAAGKGKLNLLVFAGWPWRERTGVLAIPQCKRVEIGEPPSHEVGAGRTRPRLSTVSATFEYGMFAIWYQP